jgi:hypothetical protein
MLLFSYCVTVLTSKTGKFPFPISAFSTPSVFVAHRIPHTFLLSAHWALTFSNEMSSTNRTLPLSTFLDKHVVNP